MKFMRSRRRTLKTLENRVRKLEKEYDENSKKRKALRIGVEESLELEARTHEVVDFNSFSGNAKDFDAIQFNNQRNEWIMDDRVNRLETTTRPLEVRILR